MAENYPVEPKVKVMTTIIGVLAFLGLALTNLLTEADNQLLLEFMPDALETFALPIVLAAVTAAGGFLAKHQYRATERPAATVIDSGRDYV